MRTLLTTAAAVKTWLRAVSPTCREASHLQAGASGHPLSGPQRLGLRIHLLLCKWCRRYSRQLAFLHHANHEHPEEPSEVAPPPLSTEARERLKQALRADSR